MGVDQTPEAQRWNEEPPTRQSHAPSFMQAPNCAPEVVVVPLDAGTLADAKTPAEAAVDAPDAKPAAELALDGADVAVGAAGDGVSGAPPAATAQGGAGCRLVLIVPFTTEEPPSG